MHNSLKEKLKDVGDMGLER